jgi:hypothetical protein
MVSHDVCMCVNESRSKALSTAVSLDFAAITGQRLVHS